MRLEAPPSRYRVVEQNGRLVVVDTAAGGGAPPKASDLLPGMAARIDDDDLAGSELTDVRSRVVAALESRFDPRPDQADAGTDDAAPINDVPTRYSAPYSAANSPLVEPPGILRSVAAVAAGNTRDDAGRLLLTTARWYDSKAPRTLPLNAAAEQWLGGSIVALLIAAGITVLCVMSGSALGYVLLVFAALALRFGISLSTGWVDRLEQS